MDNRWARINAAFSEILTCDATERSVVMDRWCAEDAEMRDRLCAMIDAHDRMGAFLEDSAFRGDPTRGTSHLSSRMRGTRIGPYELLSLIGFGGEGAVFEVRSDGASDRFALKLLHRRCVADEGALRAWRREAGVLAGLSHPAIAGFVDAGVSVEGAPYIVMERAAGVPLNRVTFNGDAA
ncbi:MAG TPA: hypothetical protein P5081_21335, partial [Phycisphaerae bacterium]|nr:hypothetical protein [Phycisphaerae bacterium]